MSHPHPPQHPGKLLRDALGEIDVTTAARKLHVSRTTLSRILNGAAGISAEMSLRLSAALGTRASLWYELQMSYDLWLAAQKKRPKIDRFAAASALVEDWERETKRMLDNRIL